MGVSREVSPALDIVAAISGWVIGKLAPPIHFKE
jgi:hypothetical protein